MRILRSKNGFTLVELSFSLLIIGLLIAGVLSARGMIKQAEFQTIMAEAESYKDMVSLFKDRYGYYPGDFPDAYAVWGNSCDSNATLCNGNGNGVIEYNTGGTTAVEAFRAWQHIYLAGLSNFPLSGIAVVAGQADIGQNVPKSQVKEAGWTFDLGTFYTSASGYQALRFGGFIVGNNLTYGIYNARDANLFNTKYDNGVANTGNITHYCASSFAAINRCEDGIVTYDPMDTTLTCYLEFKLESNVTFGNPC